MLSILGMKCTYIYIYKSSHIGCISLLLHNYILTVSLTNGVLPFTKKVDNNILSIDML